MMPCYEIRETMLAYGCCKLRLSFDFMGSVFA